MAQTWEYIEWRRQDGVEIDPLLTIHDQLICETDEDKAEEVAEDIKGIFESCCPLRVPVLCEYDLGKRWEH